MDYPVFFIAGFTVINIRVSQKKLVTVPAVVGKLYLEEHNKLETIGFKIKLNNSYSIDYPNGYIIAQSLSPGVLAKFGQKIELLVNVSIAIIEMPNLVGTNQENIPQLLQNIRVGKRLFNLPLSTVTKVTSEYPIGEVIAQFPPAKTTVRPDTPVSILVSAGDKEEEEEVPNKASLDLQGVNIEIAKRYAYHINSPLKIETIEVSDIKQNAIVIEAKIIDPLKHWSLKENTVLLVTVGQFTDESIVQSNKEFYPYQFIWLSNDDLNIDDGLYTIGTTQNTSTLYDPYSLVYFTEGASIPFFLVPEQTLYFWENKIKIYHNINNNKTTESTDTKEVNLLLKETDESSEKKTDEFIVPKPNESFTFKSTSI